MARITTTGQSITAIEEPQIGRRELLRLAAGVLAAGAGGSTGCGGGDDYGEEDARILAERIDAGRARAGAGRFGELRFRGYTGLAELPEFGLDEAGELVLAKRGVPRAIDIHAHLGVGVFLAPRVDLLQRTERVRHFLDDPEVLDLDVYMNDNFTPEARRRLTREQLRQLVLGSEFAATHTAPNLVAELDRMGFERACVLPIALGLPGTDLTEDWIGTLAGTPLAERLVLGASVHPRDDAWQPKLRRAVAGGARIVKLHPEFQRFFPDAPEAMEVYAECERLDVPVIFHAGRSGIEPEFLRKYALMRRYVGAVESFPNVRFVFGHAGARDLPDAVEIARRAPGGNVWLGTASIGVSALDQALAALGPERMALGSDWPFYHVGSALAKALIITRGDAGARRQLVRGSALEILGG